MARRELTSADYDRILRGKNEWAEEHAREVGLKQGLTEDDYDANPDLGLLAQHALKTRQSMAQAEEQEGANSNTAKDLAKAFGRDAVGTAESMLRSLEWLGTDVMKPIADGIADFSEKHLTPNQETFWTDLAGAGGSAATFFVPGGIFSHGLAWVGRGAKAVQSAGKLAKLLQNEKLLELGGLGISTVMESMAEAGQMYDESLMRGMSKEEANANANKAFAANAALIGLTGHYSKIFDPKDNPFLKKLATAFVSEGTQEAGQSAISDLILEGKVDVKNMMYSGLLGGIVSSGMTTAGSAAAKLRRPKADPEMEGYRPGATAELMSEEQKNATGDIVRMMPLSDKGLSQFENDALDKAEDKHQKKEHTAKSSRFDDIFTEVESPVALSSGTPESVVQESITAKDESRDRQRELSEANQNAIELMKLNDTFNVQQQNSVDMFEQQDLADAQQVASIQQVQAENQAFMDDLNDPVGLVNRTKEVHTILATSGNKDAAKGAPVYAAAFKILQPEVTESTMESGSPVEGTQTRQVSPESVVTPTQVADVLSKLRLLPESHLPKERALRSALEEKLVGMHSRVSAAKAQEQTAAPTQVIDRASDQRQRDAMPVVQPDQNMIGDPNLIPGMVDPRASAAELNRAAEEVQQRFGDRKGTPRQGTPQVIGEKANQGADNLVDTVGKPIASKEKLLAAKAQVDALKKGIQQDPRLRADGTPKKQLALPERTTPNTPKPAGKSKIDKAKAQMVKRLSNVKKADQVKGPAAPIALPTTDPSQVNTQKQRDAAQKADETIAGEKAKTGRDISVDQVETPAGDTVTSSGKRVASTKKLQAAAAQARSLMGDPKAGKPGQKQDSLPPVRERGKAQPTPTTKDPRTGAIQLPEKPLPTTKELEKTQPPQTANLPIPKHWVTPAEVKKLTRRLKTAIGNRKRKGTKYKKKGSTPELPVDSAIRFEDGTMFTGPIAEGHLGVMGNMPDEYISKIDDTTESLFVTNKGRPVSRDEAGDLIGKEGPVQSEDIVKENKFADDVLKVAGKLPGVFGGEKVFINHVYKEMKKANPNLTEQEFKDNLVKAHRANRIDLSRADLVEAMDPVDVKESNTKYMTSTFNFIKKPEAPAKPKPKVEKAKEQVKTLDIKAERAKIKKRKSAAKVSALSEKLAAAKAQLDKKTKDQEAKAEKDLVKSLRRSARVKDRVLEVKNEEQAETIEDTAPTVSVEEFVDSLPQEPGESTDALDYADELVEDEDSDSNFEDYYNDDPKELDFSMAKKPPVDTTSIPDWDAHVIDLEARAKELDANSQSGYTTQIIPTNLDKPANMKKGLQKKKLDPDKVMLAGAIDHETKMVYIFADHVANPKDLLEVWLHEHVGHAGLQGVFGQYGAFRDFAKRSFESLNKTHPDLVADTAKKYFGVDNFEKDLTSTQKIDLMEEVLARRAEEINPEVKRGIWTRFKNFLKSWLPKNLLGKDSIKVDDKLINDVLKAAEMHVFQGADFATLVKDALEVRKPKYLDNMGKKYQAIVTNSGMYSWPKFQHSDKTYVDWIGDVLRESPEALDWYNNHQQLIEDTVGPDASLLNALLGVTSPQAAVPANTMYAVESYLYLTGKRKMPNAMYPNEIKKKIDQWLTGKKGFVDSLSKSSSKVNEFIRGLLGATDTTVNDMWMHQALFGSPLTKSNPKGNEIFSPAEDVAARLKVIDIAAKASKKYGREITPKQTQAALWVWIKSNKEGKPIQNFDFKEGFATKTQGRTPMEELLKHYTPDELKAGPLTKQLGYTLDPKDIEEKLQADLDSKITRMEKKIRDETTPLVKWFRHHTRKPLKGKLKGTKREADLSTYSRSDLGNRMESVTKEWPYQPVVYAYEASSTPEPQLRNHPDVHLIAVDSRRIYDGVTDPLGLWEKSRAAWEKTSRWANHTNIMIKMVKDTGLYDGMISPAPSGSSGSWLLAFEDTAVTESPQEVKVRASTVVQKGKAFKNLSQDLVDLERQSAVVTEPTVTSLRSLINQRYPGVKMTTVNRSLAQFGGATEGQREYGFDISLRGSPTQVRAFLSEAFGLRRRQNQVIIEQATSKAKADGRVYTTTFPEGVTIKDVQDAIETLNIEEFNVVLKNGRVTLDHTIGNWMVEAGIAKTRYNELKALADHLGAPAFEVSHVRSEVLGDYTFEGNQKLAETEYKKHIQEFFTAPTGTPIFNEAKKGGTAHAKTGEVLSADPGRVRTPDVRESPKGKETKSGEESKDRGSAPQGKYKPVEGGGFTIPDFKIAVVQEDAPTDPDVAKGIQFSLAAPVDNGKLHELDTQVYTEESGDTTSARGALMVVHELLDQGKLKVNTTTSNLEQEFYDVFYQGKPEKKIKRTSETDDAQMAMHLYLDTKGKESEVRAHKAKVEQELTTATGAKASALREQLSVINAYEDLTPNLKNFADTRLRSWYEDGFDFANKQGLIETHVDNYVKRLWNPPEGKEENWDSGNYSGFRTQASSAKQRSFGSILDGWKLGMTLKQKGAIPALNSYLQELHAVAAHKKYINYGQHLKGMNGVPMFVAGLDEKQMRKVGYRPVEIAAFKQRNISAPPNIATNLEKMFQGDSFLSGIPGAKQLQRFNASTKSWVLSVSLFHYIAGVRSYYFGVSKKPHQNFWKAHKEGLDRIKNLEPVIVTGVKNGLTLGETQDWTESMLQESKGFIETIAYNKDLKGVLKVIKKGKLARERFTKHLFGKFFAGLKAEAFAIEYGHELQKDPLADADTVAERVARLINEDFGGLHQKRRGRSTTLQKIASMMMLAPDWTESNFRTVTGAMGLNPAINKFLGEMPEPAGMPQLHRKFWRGAIVKLIGSTALGHLAMSLFHDDDEYADFMKDQFSSFESFAKLRWTGVPITPLYRALGIDTGGDYRVTSVGGHFFDPLKFMNPDKLIKGKISPAGKIAEQFWTGSDYAERPFTSLSDLIETGKTIQKSRFNEKSPLFSRIPSTLLNTMIGLQPIAGQALYKTLMGEDDWLIGLSKAGGLHTSVAWNKDVPSEKMAAVTREINKLKKKIEIAKATKDPERYADARDDIKEYGNFRAVDKALVRVKKRLSPINVRLKKLKTIKEANGKLTPAQAELERSLKKRKEVISSQFEKLYNKLH